MTWAIVKGLLTDWIENGWSTSPAAITSPATVTTTTPKSWDGTSASAGM